MILFIHALFGAVVGHIIKNFYLAIILAFFSHYLLDFFPHNDYSWGKGRFAWLKNLLKVSADAFLGFILIFLFSKNQPAIYWCAFAAIIPDCFTIINRKIHTKILDKHTELHCEKIHYFKNKKIPLFWRIFSQIFIIIFSIYLLKI